MFKIILTEADKERFWTKVDIGADNECWRWQACKNKKGYGRFKLSVNRNTVYAHRVSYVLAYGGIDDDKLICHSCDNTSCCNYFHLWPGSNTDNMRDMVNKGKHPQRLPENRIKLARAKIGKKKSNSKSGVVGVYWHERDQRWCAFITANKKTKWLGYFDSKKDAQRAYEKALKETV